MNNNFGKLIIGSMPVGSESINLEMKKAIIESDYILCEYMDSFIHSIYNDNDIATESKICLYKDLPVEKVIDYIRGGKTVLLTTECGYPSIADPGAEYISACNIEGLDVRIIAGASIASMAFVASGLSGDKKGFIYHSFFDFTVEQKIKILSEVIGLDYPIVILDYNKSYYNLLEKIKPIANNLVVSICADLSSEKSYIHTCSIDDALQYFYNVPSKMHSVVIGRLYV